MSKHPPDPLHDVPEGACLDPEQPAQLRHWAARLGVDLERLRAAVTAVGPEIHRLRDHLAGAPIPDQLQGKPLPLPEEDERDAGGDASLPHYDIHKEAS